MIRYFIHFISWIIIVSFEFGFLNSLPVPWSLIPLGICIGIYNIFNLKPYVGMFWLVGMGIANELHSVSSGGDILIFVLLGLVLVYAIEQHVTHISLYPAVISAGIITFFWVSSSAIFRIFRGSSITISTWMNEAFLTAIIASVTMLVIMLFFPYIKKIIRSNIRLS